MSEREGGGQAREVWQRGLGVSKAREVCQRGMGGGWGLGYIELGDRVRVRVRG